MTDMVTTTPVPLDIPVLPAEPEPDELLAILRGGRDAVRRGWCQKALRDEVGNVCALGGLLRTLGGEVWRGGHVSGARDAMGDAMDKLEAQIPGGIDIVRFNNAPGTTQADVLAVFDRAIEARKGELQ